MTKLIGCARVSTRQQSTDRQQTDLLAACVRRDDLYVDHGVSGARASRPEFDRAIDALLEGDTLVITTLDRLGRSTQNMLAFADELRSRGAGLRVLNLGGRRHRDTDGVDAVHNHGGLGANGTRDQTRTGNRFHQQTPRSRKRPGRPTPPDH
jgi:DNA invertase Pin-like site-specific DNA recombinase